jgi:hypothetical protein
MVALVAGRFAQVESRRRARMSVLGLLLGAERKNSWTIAEQAGHLNSRRPAGPNSRMHPGARVTCTRPLPRERVIGVVGRVGVRDTGAAPRVRGQRQLPGTNTAAKSRPPAC